MDGSQRVNILFGFILTFIYAELDLQKSMQHYWTALHFANTQVFFLAIHNGI
jgi:hypothetical protein